jgi:inhibitor of cysteine peptidase
MVTVDRKANNTQVVLTIGEDLQVTLPENPTTGFRWQLEASGEPLLQLLDEDFDSSAVAAGSGGNRRWRFKAVHKGATTIEMVYRRIWQKGQSPAETFRLTINVEA